jgi:hypothetical protein
MNKKIYWSLVVFSYLMSCVSLFAANIPASRKLTVTQISEMLHEPSSNLTGATAKSVTITVKRRGTKETVSRQDYGPQDNKTRVISAGASAGKYLHLGQPKSGSPVHCFETKHGEFVLFDNSSLLVINYIGAPTKDVSENSCPNVEACRMHLKDCGIVVVNEYGIDD